MMLKFMLMILNVMMSNGGDDSYVRNRRRKSKDKKGIKKNLKNDADDNQIEIRNVKMFVMMMRSVGGLIFSL